MQVFTCMSNELNIYLCIDFFKVVGRRCASWVRNDTAGQGPDVETLQSMIARTFVKSDPT